MDKVIKKALETKPPKLLLDFCGIDYSPYYHLMYLLARQINDGVLVELGVHQGRGIFSLALANKTNKVYGVDTSKRFTDLESKFLNFTFLNQASLPPSENLTSKIDLLHIDTEHSHSMAKAEFISYKPFFKEGTIVLFDDLHAENNGVRDYFLSLPYPKWEDDRLHPSCGYGILIYQGE